MTKKYPPADHKSKDEEAAGVSRTVSQEVAPPPPSGLTPRLRVALWVAVAVLVAASVAAVTVGVVGGLLGPSSGGGSSSSSNGDSMPTAGGAAAQPATPLVDAPATAGAPSGTTSGPAAAAAAVPPPVLPTPPSSVANFSGMQPPFLVPDGFKALWWDEFDSLDTGRWQLQAGTPAEPGREGAQRYTPDAANLAVAEGNLTLTLLKAGAGYTSARLDSRISGSWHPGMRLSDGSKIKSVHVAARIRVPAGGSGLLAALRMLPVESKYGKWPASGQIDIMLAANDMKAVLQGIQYGDSYPDNEKSDVETELPDRAPYSTDFQLFALDWERDSLAMKIDGKKTDSFDSWWTSANGASHPAPFDTPFSIVLDLAVGSTPADPVGPDTPAGPRSMTVDYVRVFAKLQNADEN